MVANGDFNENPIPSDCADSSVTYAYQCPNDWSCSSFVEGCDGLGGIVTVSSSDTAWGGGGSPSGAYYLSIQATETANAYISQTIATSGNYILSFYARSRPDYPIATQDVYIGDTLLLAQQPSTAWTKYTLGFSALSSEALQFVTEGNSDCDYCAVEIDQVVVIGKFEIDAKLRY